MLRNRLFFRIVLFPVIFLVCLLGVYAYADEIVFEKDFEDGWGLWYADNGVWEVGTLTAGPADCHGGSQCAGTVLGGDYPGNTDSRLISPPIDLPAVSGGESIYLRFWQWFSYAGGGNCDVGYIQISTWDEVQEIWSSWEDIGNSITDSSLWSKMVVELKAYASERVRIGFYHTATTSTYPYNCSASDLGWYIDDIDIIRKVPEFIGDFESGREDWGADRGVWQIGTPTAGPANCRGGFQCAGTVLDGNYPGNADSRLVSSSIDLPAVGGGELIFLRFWQWFSYAGGGNCDVGHIQVSEWDEVQETWSSWTNVGNPITDSSPWSPRMEDLTAYSDSRIRIAFYHTATTSTYPYNCSASDLGWYIDEIEFPGISPVIEDKSFDEYVPPPSASTIAVIANDPSGGNLTYNWEALDGGEISGQGPEIEFSPPTDYRYCPYRVWVAACSDLTHICSTEVIKVYTRLPGDADENGVVNVIDKVRVRNCFGQPGTGDCEGADVNCDGTVNILDKVQVRNYFGQSE